MLSRDGSFCQFLFIFLMFFRQCLLQQEFSVPNLSYASFIEDAILSYEPVENSFRFSDSCFICCNLCVLVGVC
jgi:hypothetical protein